MTYFMVRRVVFSGITLLLSAIMVFFATEVLPGDPATQILGREATPEALALLREQLGLNTPAFIRFGEWVQGVLRGDLGVSLVSQQPVLGELAPRLRNTLLLAAVTLGVGATVSLILGIIAALSAGRALDHIISVGSVIAMSLPEFVVATVLVLVFAIYIPIFPAVTLVDVDAPLGEVLPSVWLPALALTFSFAAYVVRILRSSLKDVLASDFIIMAKLKGASTASVILRHALPNALAPTLNVLAVLVGWMIGGVVVVETIFNYPGIGQYVVEAVQNRDLPVLQALALLGAVTYVVTSLLADAGSMVLNPRLRGQRV